MAIKVGEYIRTKKGVIGKIIQVTKNESNKKFYSINWDIIKAHEIKKHSKNIIDLIEVRRLCEWNFSYRKRKYFIIYRN